MGFASLLSLLVLALLLQVGCGHEVFVPFYMLLSGSILRGQMGLRAKSVNTLCNKILFTLKIEKNIPNKMAQTRVL